MEVHTLEVILREHPFFRDLEERYLQTIVGCASNRRFGAGEYLWRAGERADVFYLVRTGTVALETYVPTRGALRVETVDEGEILGWSWLLEPYRWHFDARAVTEVRAFGMDAACLRGKAEGDHELGYQLLRRFLPIIEERLEAMRLKLLDIYGEGGR